MIALFLLAGAFEVTNPRVVVRSEANESALAGRLAEQARDSLVRLENEFGLMHQGRVTIVLASNPSGYQAAQPDGQSVPSWSAGVAWPGRNLIVLKSWRASPGLDVPRVLNHELGHLVLARVFRYANLPQWLDEGLTMHLADDWGLDRQVAMARALASGGLIPLADLTRGFPRDVIGAETAYAESYYFLSFLKDRYGRGALGRLITHLGLGAAPESALFRISGLGVPDLEEEFKGWLVRRFSVFWIVTGPGTIWVLSVLLLIVGVIIKRRASARKLAEWEAEGHEPDSDSERS
ncbi:MAG: hypothetical protein KKB20_25300 [Proteobacteria bacterium]|nr:hypothetical protein [Pseudomonadota bacterium]